MTHPESLICYAVLMELGPDYWPFADAVRTFELKPRRETSPLPFVSVRLGNSPPAPIENATHTTVLPRGRNRKQPPDRFDPDAALAIAADFCEERGRDDVAEWLRAILSREYEHHLRSFPAGPYMASLKWCASINPREGPDSFGADSLGEIALLMLARGLWPCVTDSCFEYWVAKGSSLHSPIHPEAVEVVKTFDAARKLCVWTATARTEFGELTAYRAAPLARDEQAQDEQDANAFRELLSILGAEVERRRGQERMD